MRHRARRCLIFVLHSAALCLLTGRAASDPARVSPSTPSSVRIARALAEADSATRVNGRFVTDHTQLFISWNGPWGTPRATRSRMPSCADTAAGDTLYLGVQFGRSAEHFTGFTATLLVHATGVDTLPPWWHMESKGGENPGAMRVEWAASAPWVTVQPFRVVGQGAAILDHDRAKGRLRLVYAVPFEQAAPVAADSVYTLARIILSHRKSAQIPGCKQPVVLEWAQSTLAFGLKDESAVAKGERWVSFSAPYAATETFRRNSAKPWSPRIVRR